ncbi:MAG: relaxase domain-containing protein [Planctomycetaceae bacterium]|nr:relaxase domain-containing protein [Planctomycetaceae bacterium]
MLRIIQNRSAVSAKSYYSKAEYYGEGQEKAGKWGGRLARMLGLEGAIQQADFEAMCDNRHPLTGEQLTARHNELRTVGYDFNWHVPKGVSLAYALGDDRRIEAVFERCVNETMLEMERETKTRVRTDGQQNDRTTGNLAWGQFTHFTTRPDDKGDVDPHLHIHLFTFNATFDQQEGKFKAVQFRDLKRDANYYEARFHSRLALALRTELGYSIERKGKSWDIAEIPAETLTKFSRRTQEIEALAEELGIESAEEKAGLGAKTRNSKSGHHSFQSLQESWRARLTPEEADVFQQLTPNRGEGRVIGGRSREESVQNALLHCFEREAVVPERTVLAEAFRSTVGLADIRDITREVTTQGLLTRTIDGRPMATMPEVLADESRVLDFARRGRNQLEALNPHWNAAGSRLSREQSDAIHQLTHSRDRVQLVLGGAGVGKTTLMTEAVTAIEAGGNRVATFAPSAEASRGVLRSEGFANATTVAELLVNKNLQKDVTGAVLWVDEASLLGSRMLRKLVDLADRIGSRLILSGDWSRQHESVERGGVLRLLDRYAGVSPAQIKTIRRQQGEYRNAIQSMSEGNIRKGLEMLDHLGWVHEMDDDTRDVRIATDVVAVVKKGQSALVVSPTHREGEHVAASIRSLLRKEGLISGDDHQLRVLKPLHLTEGERRDGTSVSAGDVLIFHQNAKKFRKGQRIVVNGRLPKEITSQAQRFSVYRPTTLKLASGDLIRLTGGGKTKDGKHTLHNGSIYSVNQILPNSDIRLKNGWVIDADFGLLTQGFVTTSHASQGRTVDHVFIAESSESFRAGSREQMYVSASRGRRSAQIYTDSKLELNTVVDESSQKVTATEVFLPLEQIRRHQRQLKAVTAPGPTRIPELAYER